MTTSAPPRRTTGRVEERAGLLAAGLRRYRLGPDCGVVVFMTDLGEETEVSVRAAQLLGNGALVVGIPEADSAVAEAAADIVRRRPRVVFACPRGTAALRAARSPALIVGDGPGVLWARAIELIEAQAASTGRAER
ncbi:hypothetical protein WIS52_04800 [Pseudonocardia nematodicida]|uniref:Uncharacterized protein n=1 Tax=Pseudonocardia nematodicida TaxID=1206997 RepID=A0ABV1K5N8_9PSEU